MDSQSAQQAALPAFLERSIRRVLRPLVRLLMSHRFGLQTVVELLKSVYVEVAEKEFPLERRRQTDSRISLLTGVHRKDVKRLRSKLPATEGPSKNVSFGARLVAIWMGSRKYLDKSGQPLPLARLARKGGAKSFEALVRSVSKDFRSRVLLDEWLRLGVARLDDEDRVHLNRAAFIPEKGLEEKAYFFGQNVHDHIAAAVHNLSGAARPFLERSVYYNELSEESAQELRRLAEVHAMKALLAINKKALELEKTDASPKGLRYRINFGTYFFSEPSEEQPDERR
jgi:hypothetical protein